MADTADLASYLENLQLENILNNQLNRQHESVKATGCCLYCHAELSGEKRWCDSDCRDDWEFEQSRRR